MTDSARHYKVNYDWLWGPANRELRKIASLSVQIRDASPMLLKSLVNDWLTGLEGGRENIWYHGGWEVDVVQNTGSEARLVLSSSGEDVAQSLQEAANSLYERVIAPLKWESAAGGEVTWVELPLSEISSQNGHAMAKVENVLITRCDQLREGDTVEAWDSGHRHHCGTVTETMPGMGLFWVREDQLGERRLVDMNELNVLRLPNKPEPH